ncbi:MAG: alpha/beta fold hydrolase [Actinomycetota bacterium]
MPITPVNGVALHYQRAGGGPDVVLIHGLAANLAFWYLAALPALSATYRVTAYDLRGHGRSGMPPSGYSSADMARDLDALLDHLGVERAHLVGHSFGAAVALQQAMRRPHRVASLTLADPTVPALRPAPLAGAWPYRPRWASALERRGVSLPADPLEGGLDLFAALAQLPPDPVSKTVSGSFVPFRGRGQEAADCWRRLLATTMARAELMASAGLSIEAIAKIEQPTLVILGGRSRWLGLRGVVERMLPAWRVEVVPDAGHFHPLVRPQMFVRMVDEFLRDVA